MGQYEPKVFSWFHGSVATTSAVQCGDELCTGVYSFQFQLEPEVEIVFIHGLQLSGDSKDAYWTTWLARDGSGNNCWPKTWLAAKFPRARILSLSYAANVFRTATSGRLDLYSLGESLVQQMVLSNCKIGQSGCPVVFVCHSFGGLVAKQLVVSGHRLSSRLSSRGDDIERLLRNVKAFFFYATPHKGSELATLFGHIPLLRESPLLEYLKIMNKDNARLSDEFKGCQGESTWKFQVVAESNATSYKGLFDAVVVEEASSRHDGYEFIQVAEDHFNVCKPMNEVDTSFLCLTDFVSKVVEEHRRKLYSLVKLPSKVVRVEDKLHELKEKMKTNSIVGLVGMGGIGKTTLSKVLYNDERAHYDKACFLEDVKSFGNIDDLWKRIGKDLGCDGTNFERSVCTKKVLLVIDDVGTSKNMEALQLLAFQKATNGSKAIVTCRNKAILVPEYVLSDGLIVVEGLKKEQAMELFTMYAFDKVGVEERKEFGILAEEIVKLCGGLPLSCGGLPLSLEVIGQFLRKQNYLIPSLEDRKEIWNCAKKRLQNAEVLGGTSDSDDARLWRKLRISYDDLGISEKSMFLDMACIFCEVHETAYPLLKSTMIRIWGDSLGLQNLVNCSLIKLVAFDDLDGSSHIEEDVLVMHEQLRGLGRRIVKDMADGQLPVNMCRLWEEKDILRIYQENKSSKTLEGLVLGRRSHMAECPRPDLPRSTVDPFENLRLLFLKGAELHVVEYYLSLISDKLRWLCLQKTRITSNSIQMLGSFKELRVLQMSGCNELEELPASIGDLSLLMELRLSSSKLKSLPGRIGNLEKLQVLLLNDCWMLERLPASVGRLKSLKRLGLYGCASLKEVPTSVGQLPRLEVFFLDACSNLETICKFDSITSQLHELHLGECISLKTIEGLGNLHCLTKLDLSGCAKLRIDNLLGVLGPLPRLRDLDVKECDGLKEAIVETLRNERLLYFDQLEELYLPVFPDTELPPWPRLKVLHLVNGLHLSALPETLGNLTCLEKLWLIDDEEQPSVKVIPDAYLCKLEGLRLLSLENFQEWKELPGFVGGLTGLECLDIADCRNLVKLPLSLGCFSQLKILMLDGCRKLESLPEGVGRLRLEHLDLRECLEFDWLEKGQFDILLQLRDLGCSTVLPNGDKFECLKQTWEELVQDFIPWKDQIQLMDEDSEDSEDSEDFEEDSEDSEEDSVDSDEVDSDGAEDEVD